MEKQRKLKQSVPGVALMTFAILLIPFLAMRFTNEVDWSVSDFTIMGVLLFGAGLAFVLLSNYATHLVYKVAAGLALCATFFMIWANLAVGLIGAGPNLGNLMYIGVVGIAILGAVRSRFIAKGMERAMFATAFAIVLVAVIALLTDMDTYPGSAVKEILMVNGFFASLYTLSGILFRYVSHTSAHRQ